MRADAVRPYVLLAAVPLVALFAQPSAAPCVKLTRAGTVVRGEAQICPGRYRIADSLERGVIVVAGTGTRLDLTGVTLLSGDTLAHEFRGTGVLVRGAEGVTITGGRISGFRFGIRIEGGSGHRVLNSNLSGSRSQALHSTAERYDERDWLDIFRPDTFELYGSALYLTGTDRVEVRGITAHSAQNGIGLFEARESFIADNDVSNNTGWGIHLWRSSANTIIRNAAHHNVRCESEQYRRGCDSAGILLRESSDSNLVVDNDLSYSGDGFFLSGHRPYVTPSIGNLVIRNDASHSYHNAFESTFSWGNTFLDNRADSSDYGFWLGYSSGTTVRGNTILGTRSAAIAIEHGADNVIADNTIVGGQLGVRLFAPRAEGNSPSRDTRIDDNTFARLGQAIVLSGTTGSRVRGNMFDGVGEALVVDPASSAVELRDNVFLRSMLAWIRADSLDAGGNYWAAASADATRARLGDGIMVDPWRSAREAGY
jgi:parallel beta-helix repeat protein